MKNIIELYAQIDLTKEPAECRVKPIDGNVWNDFGYWLEVTGFMAYNAMQYREWNQQQIQQYITEYIGKCLNDYKIKSLPTKTDKTTEV